MNYLVSNNLVTANEFCKCLLGTYVDKCECYNGNCDHDIECKTYGTCQRHCWADLDTPIQPWSYGEDD